MTRVLKPYEETPSLRDWARGEPELEAAATAAAVGPTAALRPRVFIIDDEESICKFVSTAVSGMDYEADYFTNATHVPTALDHCSPFVIFLDIALGSSDAIVVIRLLGKRQYRGVVQLMSGRNAAILEDVRRVGEWHELIMLPPLQKPFRIDSIRKVLADAHAVLRGT
jgi:DNA-binding NtrC family response regulator